MEKDVGKKNKIEIAKGDYIQFDSSILENLNYTSKIKLKPYIDGSNSWAKIEEVKDDNDNKKLVVTDNLGNVIATIKEEESKNIIRGSNKDLVAVFEPIADIGYSIKPIIPKKDLVGIRNPEDINTSPIENLLNVAIDVIKKKDDTKVVTNRNIIPISDITTGKKSGYNRVDDIPSTLKQKESLFDTSMGITEPITYVNNGKIGFRNLTSEELKSVGSNSVKIDDGKSSVQKTIIENEDKKAELLKENKELIQNGYLFPYYQSPSTNELLSAKYDYQIIPGDERYQTMVTLEDKLTEARAVYGIPIHGNNNIARAMKYYTYNRWKTPDTNLAMSKLVTYVFFTRPDLNLLTYKSDAQPGTANSQVKNNTSTYMIWRRNPDLFKLLTNYKRCGDDDNFNFLLSNQVNSFELTDDSLNVTEVGKSWNEHSVPYGDTYTGTKGGTFTCSFTEISDLSIINLTTLWTRYISNVANGLWSPSYNLFGTSAVSNQINASYVYTKTLDYASSAYVFVCGPDGGDILYWVKYYGIFPINVPISALSWSSDDMSTGSRKVNITFQYAFKDPMNIVSLIEFNKDSGIIKDQNVNAVSQFNPYIGHSARPFVGAPFIEIRYANKAAALVADGVNYATQDTRLRLKFKKPSDKRLTDNLLYSRVYIDNERKKVKYKEDKNKTGGGGKPQASLLA